MTSQKKHLLLSSMLCRIYSSYKVCISERMFCGYEPRTKMALRDWTRDAPKKQKKAEEHPLFGMCRTLHLTEELWFFLNISQRPLLWICPHFLDGLVHRHYRQMANCRYHDMRSTRAQTITRTRVLVNMCHITFALTEGKEGSEDRKAVGISVALGSPFLQGIRCLVERWGPDRELWHSALSHYCTHTHTFSWTSSVC